MFGGVGMAEDDEDQTMELTIEALTGTVYDLCVSPYETILGIKMKIQRLEGKKSSLRSNRLTIICVCVCVCLYECGQYSFMLINIFLD